MPFIELLNRMPLWSVCLFTVLLILVPIEVGFRFGRARRRRAEQAANESIGAVVGALLGLLAFLLAFTFGIASSHFQARKQLLLDEVNAIGTASLRAGLLAEPHRAEVQRLFREYVDLRVDMVQNPGHLHDALVRAEAIQGELWSHAVTLAQEDRDSDVYAIFIESLNTVFDLQTSRLTFGFQYRLPAAIWLMLYLVTAMSMLAVGYQFGLTGMRALAGVLVLAVAFSAVMLLVTDLDRPQEGLLRVSQQPMLDLQQRLNAGGP
jgi:uncharacterized membrane protein YbhN (UPF0104 family)